MIDYSEGAKCILRHCHDLNEKPQGCKRKFVRSTILSPHTNGVTRVFSRVNGPTKDFFECSGELAKCGCMHSEPQVILDLVKSVPDGNRIFQYIMICSYSPCTSCSNTIIMSNCIDAVIYDKITQHDLRGEERLKQVMPVTTVRRIEEIANGSHRGELCFIKRWGND